jgi:hypothetical protein
MTNPAEQAAPQPDVEVEGAVSQPFDVHLPVSAGPGTASATHVAHLRGDEVAYTAALESFVATGSEASAPLRRPIGDSTYDEIVRALSGLGGAVVEGIERLDTRPA